MQHQNITTVPGPQMLLCKQNFLPLVSIGAGGEGGEKAFSVRFVTAQAPYDSVSGSLITTVLDATRYGYAGGVFGQDVPVIESGKLLTNGAYTQLIKKSEDISDSSVWLLGDSASVTSNQATAPDGTLTADLVDFSAHNSARIYQFTSGIEVVGEVFTYSFWARSVSGSGTFPNTVLTPSAQEDFSINLTPTWTLYSKTFTATGDGIAIYVGNKRDGIGSLEQAYVWGAQVTKSTYRLPYVPNDTTSIKTVPLNYSDADEGIKAIGIAANFPQLLDALYGTDGTDAQGRLTIPWTPRFDASDVSGVVHTLTANDDATSFLFYNGATQEIHAYDGTNTAVVACTPVNSTEYQIILDYGNDNGQKMWLTVDTTVGLQVTYAGSFPHTADDLSIAWEEEVPQEIGSIIILKEPVLMVPPASPPTGFDWVVDSGEGYILDDAGNYIYA